MQVITARFLIAQFKYAVLLIFIISAVITPTGDPSRRPCSLRRWSRSMSSGLPSRGWSAEAHQGIALSRPHPYYNG